jgi:hypothetical protein
MTSQADLKSTAVIKTDDVTCARCGYLLRGLDPAGNCPECNHPIAASIEAQTLLPARRALRALRRGAIAMLIAVAAFDLPYKFAYSDYRPSFGGRSLNPDGTRHLGTALLLLPAAWWLSRSERAAAVRRRVTFALPLLLTVLATVMFAFLHKLWWPGQNGILLTSYLLAPFVVAIEIILLFGILARRAREISSGPRAQWMRLAQWSFGGLLMISAVADAPVTVARILAEYGWYKPPEDRYIPAWFAAMLQPIYTWSSRLRGPAWCVALIALLFYTIALFRRTRFAAR